MFDKNFNSRQINPLGKTLSGKRKCEIESSWRIVFVNKQRKGAGSCSSLLEIIESMKNKLQQLDHK